MLTAHACMCPAKPRCIWALQESRILTTENKQMLVDLGRGVRRNFCANHFSTKSSIVRGLCKVFGAVPAFEMSLRIV